MGKGKDIVWFDDIGLVDIPSVGGKNSGLGELTQLMKGGDVAVPPGFAINAQTFVDFIDNNGFDKFIASELTAYREGVITLSKAGSAIRQLICSAEFNQQQADAICQAYQQLCDRVGRPNCDVAVRSSATAEDLPEASFAGQQESYLNIQGPHELLNACRLCYASLYTDRAIAYRIEKGFGDQSVALSVGVQQMVRSDRGCSGVMFTLDTESGFPDVVLIDGSWGLGEAIVKGSVNPDRFMVYKPLLENPALVPIIDRQCGSKLVKLIYDTPAAARKLSAVDEEQSLTTVTVSTSEEERETVVLSDQEVVQLANTGVVIEKHFGCPMDIEWAKSGDSGQLFLVQARPETVESQKDSSILHSYHLQEHSTVLVQGSSIGNAVANGKICYLADPAASESFPDGAILVTERTDPDWVPVMRKAAGIITDAGGPTSHAAIVSRELKVPAIVGTGNSTKVLKTDMDVTIDCASGALGSVYSGLLPFSIKDIHIDDIAATKTDLMINVAMPDGALKWWQLPTAGVGLARIEFIISSQIRIHPMALIHPEKVTDSKVAASIADLTRGFEQKQAYFVEKLALGMAKIAASCYPKPAIIRFSDFKSNEYRGLLGGSFFELTEENPMLGLRGASRYYHRDYREAFQLECQAVKRVREIMGFRNVIVMIPFCRTPKEADDVLKVMSEAGLNRGVDDLQVYIMCEIPSNIILAEQFAQRVDGFSIGSNDLTQLVLGVDRESSELRYLFDARDEAVKRMIAQVIDVAHKQGCKVGICGQAPSDYPEFSEFLVECGIDSISLNPDSILQASHHVYAAEKKLR